MENVDNFRYLGSLISTDNSCEKDILSRICLAQASFNQLYTCLFSREDVSISTKMRVYDYVASVRSVLLYSCEFRTIKSSLSSILDSCEMSFLLRILGVRGFPYPPNEEVRSRCHVEETISQIIKRRHVIWLEHVLRIKDSSMP